MLKATALRLNGLDAIALENPGKIPLELDEVQSVTYLGEDDIVRFSGCYGRV